MQGLKANEVGDNGGLGFSPRNVLKPYLFEMEERAIFGAMKYSCLMLLDNSNYQLLAVHMK